jgi:hypothetical protein
VNGLDFFAHPEQILCEVSAKKGIPSLFCAHRVQKAPVRSS